MIAVSFTHARLILAVAAVVVAASACSDGSPTSPSPTPPTAGGPPPPGNTPTPNPVGALTVQINPNPVPHSGAPITDAAGCANVRYTWYYNQVISETGGATVTLTNRIDLFDERETNNRAVNIVIPANGSTTIATRWCSSARAAHSAQTRWTGTDAGGRSITVLGPKVTLSMP
jgi:hypothetical protein